MEGRLAQSPKNRFAWRFGKFLSDSSGYACKSRPSDWVLPKAHYKVTEGAMTLAYTRTCDPGEFNMGARHLSERWFPDGEEEAVNLFWSTCGLDGLGMCHPENNPMDLIPRATFGGVRGGASISYNDNVLEGLEPFHFGHLGGLPLRLISFLVGLAGAFLSIFGFLIWLLKARRSRQADSGFVKMNRFLKEEACAGLKKLV